MAGLNNIREAYEQVYAQLDERMDDDAREMRRLAAAERRAGKSDRMDSKVASKYADSEAKSAAKADKKSRGKHIHGMADSVEIDGDLVDEAKTVEPDPFGRPGGKYGGVKKGGGYDRGYEAMKKKLKEIESKKTTNEAKDDSYLETNMKKRQSNNEKAIATMKKTKGYADMVKAARKHFDEETIAERQLDPTETKEKERLVKGLKKSASDFKARYGERAKSVMYATATKMAKDRMDTSKSDRRYGVER